MIRRQVAKGVLWSGAGQFLATGMHYLLILVFAWILGPGEIGLVSLALVVIRVVKVVGELSLSAALVQRRQVSHSDRSTAFWASLLLSGILCAILWLIADKIAILMYEPALTPILRVLAFMFPTGALVVVPRAMLYSSLRFRDLAVVEIAGEIVYGVVGIIMALTGWGVWSLVGAELSRMVVISIGMWRAWPWFPALSFDWHIFRDLLSFGLPDMMSHILNQILANIDYFLIGRYLGVVALGYYTLAFQIAVTPVQRLEDVFRRVTFPTFSAIQDQRLMLGRWFSRTMEYLLLIAAPFCLLLLWFAPYLTKYLYDVSWQAAVPLVQILVIAGLFYVFQGTISVFRAVGKPILQTALALLRVTIFLTLVFGLELIGTTEGVAWSIVWSAIVAGIVSAAVVWQLTKSPISGLLSCVLRPIALAALAAAPALLTIAFELVVSFWASIGLVLLHVGLYAGLVWGVYGQQLLVELRAMFQSGSNVQPVSIVDSKPEPVSVRTPRM